MKMLNRFTLTFIFLLSMFAAFAAQAEDVQLKHQDLTLNAHWQPVGDEWQSQPVILITHGTLGHGRMEITTALQELLGDAGLSSLSITLSLGQDQREGMYDCETVHRHKHTDALDEIGLWLHWLQEQGAQDVVLLGHSRGANQTAWFAAERDADLIQKVVLIAPQTWDAEYAASSYEKSYGVPLEELLEEARARVKAGKGDTELKTQGFIYCPQATATAEAVLSYYEPDSRFDTPGLLTGIDKPVLVIAGSEDDVVPGLPERLAPMADKGDIELVTIDGADHFFRDFFADDMVGAIRAFVEK